MIERVARAIAQAQGLMNANKFTPTQLSQSGYIQMARAAIAAMREPTDDMLRATKLGPIFLSTLMDRWRAMIDAALLEEK